jgi:hypothetical protein
VPGLSVIAALGALLMAAFAVAGIARPDTAVIPAAAPAAGASSLTPLEQVASQIASTIAGRPVSVRCEGDTGWPGDEGGHVDSTWNAVTGQLVEVSNLVDVSGTAICLPL